MRPFRSKDVLCMHYGHDGICSVTLITRVCFTLCSFGYYRFFLTFPALRVGTQLALHIWAMSASNRGIGSSAESLGSRELSEEDANDSRYRIAEQKPLVHCITNFVSMDFMANALCAIGASPAMVSQLFNAIPQATISANTS